VPFFWQSLPAIWLILLIVDKFPVRKGDKMLLAEIWHTIGVSTASRTHKISGTEHDPTDEKAAAKARQIADDHVAVVAERAGKLTEGRLSFNSCYSVPVDLSKPDPRIPRGGVGIA
jgi:hypothetical protein